MHDVSKNPLEKLLGLAMWGPGVAWLAGSMSTLMLVQRFAQPDRIDWLTRIYTRGQVLASGTRIRAKVHPSIDPNRVYMFAQNHVNLLDHCACYHLTPHFKQGIELASHFDIPIYGWYMRQRGTIPVLREGSSKQALKQFTQGVRREVERGHSLIVFPEGTRTMDGRVGPFKQGVFRLAHQLQLPIVPVAVTGMFEVMRKGEPYINPGRTIHVTMDTPVETKGLPKSQILAITQQVRDRIASHIDAYYSERAHGARGAISRARPSEKGEQGAT